MLKKRMSSETSQLNKFRYSAVCTSVYAAEFTYLEKSEKVLEKYRQTCYNLYRK